ncbi:restriction endonuclease subunit S [Staphylococcus chromogenes]|nr:restriction endonuclease subunit S [Staphylococcus chromogenes]
MRFPEFRDEWEMKIIKELFNVVSGSTPLRSNTSYYENGNIPWVKTTDLNNSLINNTSEKVTDIALNSLKLLPKDTVLIAMYGGFNQIGRTGILNIKATTNQAISALIKKDDYNSKFLQSYLNFNVKQWRRFAASSRKDPNITKKDIEKFKIPYTCREEQEKIGTFFSKLDRQIELEEKKLELLEQQKKGYMQKIFSQELRFKDENGNEYPEWEETTIEKTTKYSSSKKSSNQYTESNDSEGYPVYDAIQEIGKDLQYDMKEPYISILKDGAGVGRLNLRAGQSSVIGTMGYLQPNNVDLQFLYYKMNMLNFKKYVIGSTIPHLYYKDYSKEKIQIPSSFEEQKKIGHFILNIDKMIEIKTFKIDYLKQRKQGLLQKMFI